MSAATISVDEFLALEQKVLQTVEIIKKERDARAAIEAERDAVQAELASAKAELATSQEEVATLRSSLAEAETKLAGSTTAQDELAGLQREREAVRLRVEGMLAKLEELL